MHFIYIALSTPIFSPAYSWLKDMQLPRSFYNVNEQTVKLCKMEKELQWLCKLCYLTKRNWDQPDVYSSYTLHFSSGTHSLAIVYCLAYYKKGKKDLKQLLQKLGKNIWAYSAIQQGKFSDLRNWVSV